MGETCDIEIKDFENLSPDQRRKLRNRESRQRWYKKNPNYFNEYNSKHRQKVTERQRAWRDKNPEKQKEYYLAYREKRRAYHKEHYQKNKEAISARNKAWKAGNSEHRFRSTKAYRLKIQYGISYEKYEELLKACNGKCPICTREFDKKLHAPCIDHCHGTGAIRGILCNKCNTAEGALETLENVERLAAYMRGFELLYVAPKQPVPWKRRPKKRTTTPQSETVMPILSFEPDRSDRPREDAA